MKMFLKGLKSGMKEFGDGISLIVNSALLLVVYFVGVGITSMFAKVLNKKFLDIKKRSDSYWGELNLKKKPLKEYYRQF